MNVAHAEFVVSNTKVDLCPKTNLPEYAFIGRSNVGKSSLINMLCNKKKLAKTSSRPGKTQLINHFLINKKWYLVDLPGYGYARASKTQKKTFQKFIIDYFTKRKELVSAFLLIDIRHNPQPIDMDFLRWLGENFIPFSIVFTKADKIKEKDLERKVSDYLLKLKEEWESLPQYFVTSSEKKLGQESIMKYIQQVNENFKKF
ncbi:MAG: ribosome biogenesis GTP-binding protein YihA/YsxC [Bacteroidota bacterium]|nr:ribosome biogenesis GTP-binding protein YihA/YsxC [Bacteroidota bacterium]